MDVNLSRKDGELLIHLINTTGAHGSEHTYIYDEITPLYGLTIEVDLPKQPTAVEAVPDGHIAWSWREGVLYISLERLDIYTILAVGAQEKEHGRE